MTSAADGTDGGRYECGVCWHVYDPAEGDDIGQVPAGTAFAELADDWSCPTCDGPKAKYMRMADDR